MENEARSGMSLRGSLRVIFKRQNTILIFFGVTVCTVAIASVVATPTYEATAQILVKVGMEAVYTPTLPTRDTEQIVRVDRQQQINSEIEILRSRFLAQKVVESLRPEVIYKDLDNSGGGFLSNLFRATEADQSPTQSNGDSIIEQAVTNLQKNTTIGAVKSSDVINVSFRHTDPQVAAKVVNTLVDLYLDRRLHVHKNPDSYTFLRDQSQILDNELRRSAESLNTFKKEHDLTSLQEERTVLLKQQADLRTKVVELELKERELLTKYTDQSRLVQGVRDEIGLVRDKLVELERRQTKLNQIEREFNRLQQEVEVDRENYRLYLTKFKESRILSSMDPGKMSNVSVIEPAQAPLKPVSPNIVLSMILAVFLGGVGAFGLAFLSEYMADNLEGAEDVEEHLRLPVLASIPQIKLPRDG
ncbi:MAG: lipopolysaccharide biosynthesis protein [candidate division NC10 bacterium CSP1-5]|nr:MAG: lipopolysaccharide biosynthesis protein [candidate division NC10 bacterium CSP1-5]